MRSKLFVLVVLAGASCTRSSDQQPECELQTYRNIPYAFQFDYPKSLGFTAPNYTSLSDKIVQIQISSEDYPNTNFADAAFAVSVQYVKDEGECLALGLNEGQTGPSQTITINKKQFTRFDTTDAAAGNIYDSRIFRTMSGSQCIELVETIHTGNIGNYPAGTVTEVDKASIWERLDQIRESFRFNFF